MSKTIYGIFGLIAVLVIILAVSIISLTNREDIEEHIDISNESTAAKSKKLEIILNSNEYEYFGQEIWPYFEVLLNGEKIDDGYTVKIDNNIKIGIATITVTLDNTTTSSEFKIVPRRLNVDNEFRSTSDSVIFNWETSDDCEYYQIYRSEEKDEKWEALGLVDKETAEYTDSGLKSASIYRYKVTACVKKGESVFESSGNSGIITMTSPEQPSPFFSKESEEESISWEKVDGAQGYEILISQNKGETELLADTERNTYELDKGSDTSAEYYVRSYCMLYGKKIYSELSAVINDKVSDDSLFQIADDSDKSTSNNSDNEDDHNSESDSKHLSSFDEKSPDSKIIPVTNILQYPELPTGCETTALTILLRYMGYNADKLDIARNHLPKLSFYTENGINYGADFRTTFAGDPESEYSYGCYAPCIVSTANSYLSLNGAAVTAHNATGTSFESLLTDFIDKDKPVLIWVTSNNLHETQLTSIWTTPAGETVQWVAYEHCVVLTGYDKNKNAIYVSDPLVGNTSYSFDLIRQRYIDLGQQCVWIG